MTIISQHDYLTMCERARGFRDAFEHYREDDRRYYDGFFFDLPEGVRCVVRTFIVHTPDPPAGEDLDLDRHCSLRTVQAFSNVKQLNDFIARLHAFKPSDFDRVDPD